MCNPRRVRVRATRELAEVWQQEVRRQVTRIGQTAGEARVTEPLGQSIGGVTLAALAEVLGRTPGWDRAEDGAFWHALDGGQIRYDPATRILEIVARVSGDVVATGEAQAVVRAEARGPVEAEGVGTYYDDGWSGRTEATARLDAEEDLRRSLEQAEETLREQARRAAEAEVSEDVGRQAAERADAAFARAAATREHELRQQAADRLLAVGAEGRTLFHQALGEAYQDAILAYARSRRASNVRRSSANGVVEIEFEMQV
jgi:hypothetical protein